MTTPPPSGEVTGLLRLVAQGDEQATARLAEIVHADLRHMAALVVADVTDSRGQKSDSLDALRMWKDGKEYDPKALQAMAREDLASPPN